MVEHNEPGSSTSSLSDSLASGTRFTTVSSDGEDVEHSGGRCLFYVKMCFCDLNLAQKQNGIPLEGRYRSFCQPLLLVVLVMYDECLDCMVVSQTKSLTIPPWNHGGNSIYMAQKVGVRILNQRIMLCSDAHKLCSTNKPLCYPETVCLSVERGNAHQEQLYTDTFFIGFKFLFIILISYQHVVLS